MKLIETSGDANCQLLQAALPQDFVLGGIKSCAIFYISREVGFSDEKVPVISDKI